MADYDRPATPLQTVQQRVVRGDWHVRREAQQQFLALGVQGGIRGCLLGLTEGDFHKAMDAEEPKWAGAVQDVYKPVVGGVALYVKFQVWPLSKELIFVVSFKEQ